MPTNSRRAPERPFNLGDALILIGAVAIGLALVRGWGEPRWNFGRIGFGKYQPTSLARRVLQDVVSAVAWTTPLALALNGAMVLLRLRSPRPSIRRIFRQPGFVACNATLAAFAFQICQSVYYSIFDYLTHPQSAIRLPSPPFTRDSNFHVYRPLGLRFFDLLFESYPMFVSSSVVVSLAVSWTVLYASRAAGPHPGWIDRTGRCLGWYWLGMGFFIAFILQAGHFLG